MISELKIKNNHNNLSCNLAGFSRINIIAGNNKIGKTRILFALNEKESTNSQFYNILDHTIWYTKEDEIAEEKNIKEGGFNRFDFGTADKDVLLFDEFDGYIQEDLYKIFIQELTNFLKNNTEKQVFIVTHSSFAIDEFSKFFNNDKNYKVKDYLRIIKLFNNNGVVQEVVNV